MKKSVSTQKMIVVRYPSAKRTSFSNRYALPITENRRCFLVVDIAAKSGLQADTFARRYVRGLIANAIDNEL